MLKTKSRAQVMIEYLMIAIIVLLAVMYGGPFLVNSIGARFAGMDGSAQDAFDEDLQQAAPPLCVCVPQGRDYTTWSPAVPDVCGTMGCGALDRCRTRACSPLGCDQTKVCLPDARCCYAPAAQVCGSVELSNVIPNPLCIVREELPADINVSFPAGAQGRCMDASGSVRGCLEGERTFSVECGRDTMHFACVPDGTCPITPPPPPDP